MIAPTTTPLRESSRLAWPDIAKGACILLVVLHHSTKLFVADLVPTELDWVGLGWAGATSGLKPIRMPLFFLISGLFAANALTRPWAAARERIVGGYWLYAVWLTVFAGVYSVDTVMPANRTQDLRDYVGELAWAATSMWFLYALVAYFVAAKALRVLPAPLVLGAALVVSLSTQWAPFEETNRIAVVFHFAYFLAGAYFPDVVRRVGAVPPSAGLLAVGFLGLTLVTTLVAVPRSVQVVALSLVGIPLGIAWAVKAADRRWLAGPLAWLGRRTLRIYVLHMVVLSAIGHLSLDLGDGRGSAAVALSVAFPILLAAFVVLGCLVLYAGLQRLGLGVLFAAPAVLVRGSGRRTRKPPMLRATTRV